MNENRLKFYLKNRGTRITDWGLYVVLDDNWDEAMTVKEWSKKPTETMVENTIQLANRSFEILSRYLRKVTVKEMDTIRQGVLQDNFVRGK